MATTSAERRMTNPAALNHLRKVGRGDFVTVQNSYAGLARMLNWKPDTTLKAVTRWVDQGKAVIEVDGGGALLRIKALPARTGARGQESSVATPSLRGQKRKRNPGQQTGQSTDKITDKSAVNSAPDVTDTSPQRQSISSTYGFLSGGIAAALPAPTASQPSAGNTPVPGAELPPLLSTFRPHHNTALENQIMGFFSRTKPAPVPVAAPAPQSSSLPAPKYNTDVMAPTWDAPPAMARPIPSPARGEGRAPRQTPRGSAWDNGIVFAAVLIMMVTAYASVNGMTTLFAGAATFAFIFGIVIEVAKFCACGWVGEHYEEAPAWHTLIVVVGIVACASLNAISVHSLLMNAHFGSRSEIIASAETKNAEAAGKIEVAQGRIADLDKQLAQIDATVSEATKRGKVKGAADLIQSQQKARAKLASERDAASRDLASLKTQKVQTTVQSKASEETSLRYLAETFGISGGAETVMKYFAAVAVAVGDPLAIFLIFVSGARRRRLAMA
jgi:hypothetical protein